MSQVSSAISIKLSTFTKKRQVLWVKEIQKRVGKYTTLNRLEILFYSLTHTLSHYSKYSILLINVSGVTSTMLGSMKGIKMSGLSQKLSELIENLRIKEVQVAKKFRLLNVYGATLGA